MRELIIFGLVGMDILLTYWNANLYKKINPSNWWTVEINPFVVFFWRRFGLEYGTIFSTLFIFIILAFFIVPELATDDMLLGMILGVYFVVFLTHLRVFLDILELKKSKLCTYCGARKLS